MRMAAQSTTLNLLTRDGGIRVTFTPALEPSQYDQLLDVSTKSDDAPHLTHLLSTLAHAWGRMVKIDPC